MTEQPNEPMLQWFESDHLSSALQKVSVVFGGVALHVTRTLPRSAERTVALRKLLEAKDAAVRCAVAEQRENPPHRCIAGSEHTEADHPTQRCAVVAVLEGERFHCSVQGPHDEHDFSTVSLHRSIRVCPRAGCLGAPGHDGEHTFG